VLANGDIQLIVIATPNYTHFDLSCRALKAGKHVVIDKPMATTSVEAQALVKLAKAKKRIVSVFQNRRWDADFRTLRKIIKDNLLGDLSCFQSNFDRFRPEVKKRWREQAGTGSGLWFDLGSHLTDQVIFLFGAPSTVCADFAVQRQGAEAVDYFHVILGYGKMRVILHGSSLVAADGPRFAVHGTAGSYVKHGLDVQEDCLKRGEIPTASDWGDDPRLGTLYLADGSTDLIPNLSGAYPQYYQVIHDAIVHGKPNPVDPDDALDVIKVLELAERSAKQGTTLAMKKSWQHDES
jgi:scyllo-inositol 2-dehydrogenase (NADP+)